MHPQRTSGYSLLHSYPEKKALNWYSIIVSLPAQKLTTTTTTTTTTMFLFVMSSPWWYRRKFTRMREMHTSICNPLSASLFLITHIGLLVFILLFIFFSFFFHHLMLNWVQSWKSILLVAIGMSAFDITSRSMMWSVRYVICISHFFFAFIHTFLSVFCDNFPVFFLLSSSCFFIVVNYFDHFFFLSSLFFHAFIIYLFIYWYYFSFFLSFFLSFFYLISHTHTHTHTHTHIYIYIYIYIFLPSISHTSLFFLFFL